MNKIDFTEQDVPKYLKQKESNTSKSSHKSKHKHQYEECLIQYRWNFKSNVFTDKIHTSLHSYCTICGKIGDKFKEDKSIVKDYRRTVDTPTGRFHQVMTDKELYERYHDKMPVFLVEDYLKDGYVNLNEDDK